MIPLFKVFLTVHHSLIALNVVWHFKKDIDILNKAILVLSYTTFVFIVFSLFFTIAAIQMEQFVLFEAIISLIFVNLPGVLLGWSAWILVREHMRKSDSQQMTYAVPEMRVQQEQPKKEVPQFKVPEGYVPVIINEHGVAQVVENLA